MEVGTKVGFADLTIDKFAYILLEIKGENAVIGCEDNDGGAVRKETPWNKLVSTDRVMVLAHEILTKIKGVSKEIYLVF